MLYTCTSSDCFYFLKLYLFAEPSEETPPPLPPQPPKEIEPPPLPPPPPEASNSPIPKPTEPQNQVEDMELSDEESETTPIIETQNNGNYVPFLKRLRSLAC